jgi:annexin A7/11
VCYRVMPQGRRDALLIRKTMTGMGCNDKTLVEILTTRTNAELKNAAEVYVKEFEEDMVERIKSETGGMLSKNYGKWIDKIVEFDRDETQDVPDNVAELAERLYDAGKGKSFGTDEDVFLEILCAANDKTIDAIKQSYADQHDGRSLIEDVISEMTGDLEYSVLARIKPRVDFFCNRLYNACKGLGTNEETVARVLGCMHNADVILLEKRFGEIYADEEGAFNTLKGMLQDELSGDFLDALLMLLEGASPKGHWIQAGLYPGRAKQSATELQTIVTDAYNEEIAVSRGKEPMLGPLDLIGVEPDGLFLTPHVDDAYPPSSPPIEVIFDKAYLLESEVTELDAGNKLLEALKDHVTKCTQWDELNKTNIEVYKPQYIKLAYDMRFVDHVVHQLDEDNNVMIEFCLDRDADLVKEACAGWGTDENLLIKVLCSLSKRQILQVDKKFRERYGQTLKEQMEGELSDFFEGDFKYFMEMLLTPNCEIDADLLYKSMEGWGTNESMLSRIVSTRSNKELEAAKATFKTKYEKTVEEWVSSETDDDGPYSHFLLRCLKADHKVAFVDEKHAKVQAQALVAAGLGGEGDVQEDAAFDILCTASGPQLEFIGAAFEELAGKPLLEAVTDLSGDLGHAFEARLLPKADFFAAELNKAWSGMGTDETATSRIFARSSKPEILKIADAYTRLYGVEFREALDKEVDGKYQKALMTYVYNAPPPIALPEPPEAAAEE